MPLPAYIPAFLRRTGAAFWLQAALLVTAALSLQFAGWVNAPLLAPASFLAAILAAHAYASEERRTYLHLRALAGGALTACACGMIVAEGDGPFDKLSVLMAGLYDWMLAVRSGETVSDQLPLSVTITALTWAMSYLTTLAFLRYLSVWLTILPVGAVTIINVTYQPGSTSPYLWAFLVLCLLVIAYETSRGRIEAFLAQGVSHPASLHRKSLAHGLWVSAALVVLAAALPLAESVDTPLDWFYNPVNATARGEIRDEVRRVFGGPSSREILSVKFLGSVLSLVRPVSNSTEPILFAEADYPYYWSAVAYDHYTSKVWKVQDTATQDVLPSAGSPSSSEAGGPHLTRPTAYTVYLYVETPYLFIAGDPSDVTPDAQQQAPSSPAHRLDLAEPGRSDDLTGDLRALESALASTTGPPDVSRIPDELRVSAVVKSSGQAGEESAVVDPGSPSYAEQLQNALNGPGQTVALEVVRAPMEDSPVLFTTQGQLGLGNSYIVESDILIADEESLRAAPRDYPQSIVERYLQIPPSLPDRVSALAAELVEGADNPYDMAVAVESHLRTLEYSGVPIFLPNEADAVDYFLFESQESYSDYFASAMAMMLRTQGVPTRLVLGFAPGEADPEGFLVRDNHNHSWPEVYFPGVGWAPFEPTPIYPVRPRGPDQLSPRELSVAAEADDTAVDEEAPREPFVKYGTPLGAGGLMFAGFMLAGAVVMRMVWAAQYGGAWTAQAAYRRMQRLAALLGFRAPSSQTAIRVLAQPLESDTGGALGGGACGARVRAPEVRRRAAGLRGGARPGECVEPHQVGGAVQAAIAPRLDLGRPVGYNPGARNARRRGAPVGISVADWQQRPLRR